MRIAVLASGVGTNLQALIDRVHGRDGAELVAVASDRPAAPALERARAAGVPARAFAEEDFPDRAARDRAMADWLRASEVRLVVLAGYMRLLSSEFLSAFPDRVVNVHPALLPAFPGVAAIEQAVAYGVKVFGVTVHLVDDDGIDSGAIIAQRAVEIADAMSPGEVHDALRPLEHDLLCSVVAAFARGLVTVDPDRPRRVHVGS
jgi:phosphoribosylglycinamide formyltransferase-1